MKLKFGLPAQVAGVSRRGLIKAGVSMTGYASAASLFPHLAWGQTSPTTSVLRKLVWINMDGGWDILEVTDPKVTSTSGIDMTYGWDQAHALAGSNGQFRIGRWLPALAAQGSDIVVVNGMVMGTTSHMAGSVYMDTGILSNSGDVNSASIPAMVATFSQATIPLIQLNGGNDVQTDRGTTGVSVVRAQDLDLYRSMYPDGADELVQQTLILDYLQNSIAEAQAVQGVNDRLTALTDAESKIRVQFNNDLRNRLAVEEADLVPFQTDVPADLTNVNTGFRDALALTLKLLRNDLVSSVNLGIGGFDTHSNQETRLQPILRNFDYLLATFVNQLRAANLLDQVLIVCQSDFGRTPRVNNSNGRDHWPVGSALLIGGGIQGGRVVGATDDDLRALNINPNSGLADTSGIQINPTHLGGAVLDLTLGPNYGAENRTYLSSIPALTLMRS